MLLLVRACAISSSIPEDNFSSKILCHYFLIFSHDVILYLPALALQAYNRAHQVKAYFVNLMTTINFPHQQPLYIRTPTLTKQEIHWR